MCYNLFGDAMVKLGKYTDIPMDVKRKVWLRDKGKCVICGNRYNVMPNAHFLPRGAKLGLGIEQNIVTLCFLCHNKMDNSIYRKILLEKVKNYLIKKYPDWKKSYDMGYKSIMTHSNYWLSLMDEDKRLYYTKE